MGQTAVIGARRLAMNMTETVDGVFKPVYPRTLEHSRMLREAANHTIPMPLEMVERIARARMRSLLSDEELEGLSDFVLGADDTFAEVTWAAYTGGLATPRSPTRAF